MLVGQYVYACGDKSRQFVDLALSAGRSIQSSVTSLIHYTPNLIDDPAYDAAPLEENFLFALTLFRDRGGDNMKEAKILLDRLLHFQNFILDQGKGSFPIFLHQYPHCHDRTLPAKLLPIFYWILKHFQLALGTDLRSRLASSAQALFQCLFTSMQEKALPFTDELTVAMSATAFGRLWENAELIEEGDRLTEHLLSLSKDPHFTEWYCPAKIGRTFVALQLAYALHAAAMWAYRAFGPDARLYVVVSGLFVVKMLGGKGGCHGVSPNRGFTLRSTLGYVKYNNAQEYGYVAVRQLEQDPICRPSWAGPSPGRSRREASCLLGKTSCHSVGGSVSHFRSVFGF